MTDQHSRREVQIFSRFALRAGGYVPASIEKRSPPEPDILVATSAGDRIAFELVEIIDEDFAQRTWGQIKLKSRFEHAYGQLEQGDRAQIEGRVGNALVHIVFDEAATFRAREAAIPLIFEYLKKIESLFVGDLRLRDGVTLPGSVTSIRVSRALMNGPCFDTDAVGSHADPTVGAIRAKCEKSYTTPHPIELLAYYELQPELPESFWRPKVETFLAASNEKTKFRRVWVYDCGSDAVRFSSTVDPTIGRGA